MLKASTISRMRSICGRRSSGILARVALYSGKIWSRKVLPVSKATARYSGFSCSRMRSSSRAKPYTPAVGSPLEVCQRVEPAPPEVRAKYMR